MSKIDFFVEVSEIEHLLQNQNKPLFETIRKLRR
jgi:hypothetical protein